MNIALKALLLSSVILIPFLSQADQPPEHLSLDCSTCHDRQQDADLLVDNTCHTCHKPKLPSHGAIAGGFHNPGDRSCSRCHDFHRTELLKATDKIFRRPFGNEQVLRHCSSCHRSNHNLDAISPGHLVAASQQYHVDSSHLESLSLSQVCLNCHDEENGNPETPPTTPAFPAHASHPIGQEIPQSSSWGMSSFRADIPPLLELVDNQIECTTCHRLSEPTIFRLVPFATVTDLCNGCHDMAPGQPAPLATKGPAIAKTNQSQLITGAFLQK